MTRGESTTTLGFLIFPGFPMSCLTSAIEPLRAANEISGQAAFDWKLIGETGARVESSAHIWFDPDRALTDDLELDYLFLLSGPLARFETPRPSNGRLRSLSRHGVRVGGVSGGVFPLARSGLLAGHRCSVHWCYAAAFAAEFPDHPVEDDVIIIDRDRLTCSGGHGAAHLAAFLVSRHVGQNAAIKSLNIMMIDAALRGEQAQPGQQIARTPRDALVKRAILRMQQNIETPLPVATLADQLQVGRRTLERRFREDLGQTPGKIYLDLRLDRALLRLRTTPDAIADIALASGFCDGPHLARTLRAERGFSPAEYRKAQARRDDDLPTVGVLLNQTG